MRAAIYARKSTEQTGADEQKSVGRQIAHAREYAARKGWLVDDAHIYVDDGISGAEFSRRPGFVRLMTALKPRPPFQALVMSEESRLGREMVATMGALKELVTAGVRVFYYLEDKERTIDSPIEKAMMALESFGAELEREKARQRSHDAAVRLIRAGHVAGGRLFGYENVDVLGPDGRRAHVERRVCEPEAAIIRRIFELCAAGHGLTAITKRLNEEHAPAPRPQQGRPRSWAPSSVREVLYRTVYRGELTWNKSQKRNKWGVVQQRDRTSGEWMSVPMPQLRIVSDELWRAAHARLDRVRQAYLRGTSGRLGGRPPRETESKYLLTGFGRCGLCGGSLYVKTKKGSAGARTYAYGCTSFHLRGRGVCGNSLEVPMELADRAVLDVIVADVLRPEIMTAAIDRAVARLRPSRKAQDLRARELRQHIAALDQQLERLVEAIAAGGDALTLTRAIQERESKRAALRLELSSAAAPRADAEDVRADLIGRCEEWRGLLSRRLPQSRRILRTILTSTIHFTPHRTGRRRHYEFTLEASMVGLLQSPSNPGGDATVFAPIKISGIIEIPAKRAA